MLWKITVGIYQDMPWTGLALVQFFGIRLCYAQSESVLFGSCPVPQKKVILPWPSCAATQNIVCLCFTCALFHPQFFGRRSEKRSSASNRKLGVGFVK